MLQFTPSTANSQQAAEPAASSTSTSTLSYADWWSDISSQLRNLQPNRQLFLDVAAAPKSTSGKTDKTKPALALATTSSSPRYTLWVLDVALTNSREAQSQSQRGWKVAAFILPQGRESEWQFRSIAGGSEIAQQNNFSRLIFIALNRGHSFTGLDQVKSELNSLLRTLAPEKMEGSMTIVSIGTDVGARREVWSSQSSSSTTHIVIEDVLVDEHVHRRMIFTGTGLVQSEARLNVPSSYMTMTPAQWKAKEKKKRAKKKSKAAAAEKKESSADAEDDVEDEDQASATTSSSTSSTPATSAIPSSASLICFNYLPCEYQLGLLAMMALPPSFPKQLTRCILVGLGGGNFAMFLHKAFPHIQLNIIELEASVLDSARQFFGFHETPSSTSDKDSSEGYMRVHVADGLGFVEEMARRVGGDVTEGMEQLDVSSSSSVSSCFCSCTHPINMLQDLIILDVNNTDLCDGLSFPPPAFLAQPYLQSVKNCLEPSGALLLNLGCRNEPLRILLLNQVARVFKHVFVLRPDEQHVNFVVAAFDDLGDSSKTESELFGEESLYSRLASLKHSSSSSFVWSDEMKLDSLIPDIQRFDPATH